MMSVANAYMVEESMTSDEILFALIVSLALGAIEYGMLGTTEKSRKQSITGTRNNVDI